MLNGILNDMFIILENMKSVREKSPNRHVLPVCGGTPITEPTAVVSLTLMSISQNIRAPRACFLEWFV